MKIYVRKSARSKMTEDEKLELQLNQIASWAIPGIVSIITTILTIKSGLW